MNLSGLISRLLLAAFVTVGLTLTACGGGGGDTGTTSTTNTAGISLYAGSLQSAGGADGQGAAAQFAGPERLALDSAGNLYISDTANQTIRKLTPDGQVSTFAGVMGQVGNADGPGVEARFSSPRGIAVRPDGTVFVADSGNHTIRKISPTGVVSTWAGAAGQSGRADGVVAQARFLSPTSLALDAGGNLYVTDQNQTVRKISPMGVVSTFLSFPELNVSTFVDQPFGLSGVAVDAAGRVYVSEISGGTVRRFNASGDASPWGSASDGFVHIPLAYDLSVDAVGGVVVAAGGYQSFAVCCSFLASSIERIGTDGVVQRIAGDSGSHSFGSTASQYGFRDGTGTLAKFNKPKGVVVDKLGVLFVADKGNYAIRKITSGSVVTTIAGGTSSSYVDSAGAQARFNTPSSMVAADDGRIFLTDGNGVVRKIDPSGSVSTQDFVNTDGTTSTQFSGTLGPIARDKADSIYVFQNTYPEGLYLHAIDATKHLKTVHVLSDVKAMVTDAENGGFYVVNGSDNNVSHMGVDGSLRALTSGFGYVMPQGLTLDSTGKLYVADWANCTISTVSVMGIVKVVAGSTGDCSYQDGTAQSARFNQPRSLAADNLGNLYIADDSYTIRKMSPGGEVSLVAGIAGQAGVKLGSLPGRLGAIRGLVWSKGALYASVGDAVLRIVLAPN
jgi:sugar lactone lactonase YvrE